VCVCVCVCVFVYFVFMDSTNCSFRLLKTNVTHAQSRGAILKLLLYERRS
jgi:hypothetical protein